MSIIPDLEDLAEFTLIITPLVKVREWLNRFAPRPVLGHWAYTPKELASLEANVLDPEDILLELKKRLGCIEDADSAWATIAPAWEELGSLEEVRNRLASHPKFKSLIEPAIIVLKSIPSSWLAREQAKSPPAYINSSKVALIGKEFLTELDSVYVRRFETEVVPLKMSGSQKPVIIKTENSPSALAACIKLIEEYGPENCAVITSGDAWSGLSSVLRQVGFRVNGSPGSLSNYPPLTWFVTLINAKLQERSAWRETVLYTLLQAKVIRHEEADKLQGFYLNECSDSLPDAAKKFLNDLECSKTFQDLLPLVKKLTDDDLEPLQQFLEKTELSSASLSLQNAHLFQKFLTLIGDKSIGYSEQDGVLVADANGAVGISRPLQILLGVDDGWLDNLIGMEEAAWRDKEKEAVEREYALNILFSQGMPSVCILIDSYENKAVMANTTLLRSPGIEVKKDTKNSEAEGNNEPLKNSDIIGWNYADIISHEAAQPEVETEPRMPKLNYWSKSTLDTMMTCPRSLYYEKFLDMHLPAENLTFGSAIHTYAEMTLWKKKGDSEKEKCAEAKLTECEQKYLSQLPSERRQTGRKKLERFKKEVDKLTAEIPIGCKLEETLPGMVGDIQLKGRIDVLLPDESLLIDFKTGKSRSMRETCKALPLGRFLKAAKDIDSQLLAYLYLARKNEIANPKMTFHFIGEMTKLHPDAEDCSLDIEPERLEYSKSLLAEMCCCGGGNGKFLAKDLTEARARFQQLSEADSKELFREILNAASILDRTEVINQLEDSLKRHLKAEPGDFVNKCIESALFFLSGKILEQDIDAFEEYVKAQDAKLHEALAAGFFSRMPADESVCTKCAYISICGNKGYEAE